MWSFLFSYSQIHYDDTFNSDTSDVTGYIDSMVTQLQAHMCQISLGTQIRIEVSIYLTEFFNNYKLWTTEFQSGKKKIA